MNKLRLQRLAYEGDPRATGSRQVIRAAARKYKDWLDSIKSLSKLDQAAKHRSRALAECRTDFVDALEGLSPTGRDVQQVLDLRRKLFDSNTEAALFNTQVEVIDLLLAAGKTAEEVQPLKDALVEAFPVPEPEPEEVADAAFPGLPPTEEEYRSQSLAAEEQAVELAVPEVPIEIDPSPPEDPSCPIDTLIPGPAEPLDIEQPYEELGGEG
jgi:hypothetical protein